MAKVSVYNIEGSQVGEIELNDSVFGVEVNEHLVHMAVVAQLAGKQASGNTEREDTLRGIRRRKETVETERYRPRKTGFNKSTSVDRRRRCICSEAENLHN